MAFGEILEYVMLIALVVVVVTQLVIPLWLGKRAFPLFRKRGHLEASVLDAEEDLEEARMEGQLTATQRHAEMLRHNRGSKPNQPPKQAS